MDWSPQQQDALDKARRWLDDPAGPQVFRLFGYAGTGKTTLAYQLAEHVSERGRALSCAYTGKAASVMAKKGLPGASTIHRLIYTPAGEDHSHIHALEDELAVLETIREPGSQLLERVEAVRRALDKARQAGGRPAFTLKSRDECAASWAPLIIVDEVSMVAKDLAADLLSFGTKVLVLGDPAQLPPVKDESFFMDAEPDALLTEIHRQARGNPILALATAAREGRELPYGTWETEQGSAAVVRSINAENALAADQILCGTNAKRRAINRRHRQLGGYLDAGPFPQAGERLVCLANDYESGLLNGTIWWAHKDAEWMAEDEILRLSLDSEDRDQELSVMAQPQIFTDPEERAPRWSHSNQLTFGYALTVHKSQGSQWDKVVAFDDWPRRDTHRQWLYTGITRAAERLVVVR